MRKASLKRLPYFIILSRRCSEERLQTVKSLGEEEGIIGVQGILGGCKTILYDIMVDIFCQNP
jgi:hypothetical protein